jgi:hypothetical protein
MKLERDLIRARDWDYSATAFAVAPDQREALRERVIRDYGAAYELILSPETAKKPKRKNKHSQSRAAQRKREIAAQALYLARLTETFLQLLAHPQRHLPNVTRGFAGA